jgi:hypothetical protein
MDNKTEALIRELANKFGTTVEHLWGVMIKQAYISSIVDIIQYIIIILAVIAFIKLHKKFLKPAEDDYSIYEDNDEWLPALMFAFGFALTIIVVISFLSIGSTITGFINPEYWALDHIINR